MAALAAGKAVYSESPLGANLGETEEMAAAVGSQHTAIGLQGSLNPSVRRAAEIIAKGAIGRVLSARVHATTFGYGPESISAYDYFNKQEAGASSSHEHDRACPGCYRDRPRTGHRGGCADREALAAGGAHRLR